MVALTGASVVSVPFGVLSNINQNNLEYLAGAKNVSVPFGVLSNINIMGTTNAMISAVGFPSPSGFYLISMEEDATVCAEFPTFPSPSGFYLISISILVICQELFEKGFDMDFRKKGNFKRPSVEVL